MHLVFTYGTLKKGFSNHVLLSSSEFVQGAQTQPLYLMYNCGWYPCLVKSEKGISIKGEIYRVDDNTLKQLDRLEGVPYLYQREVIQLKDFDQPVLAYFYQRSVDNFELCGDNW